MLMETVILGYFCGNVDGLGSEHGLVANLTTSEILEKGEMND